MTFSQKDDYELQMRANKELSTSTDPLHKLRYQCLARGAKGIKGFSRQFRIMDDDGNKRLNEDEFITGCQDFGLEIDVKELKELFHSLDKDESGSIEFNEFLVAMRPPLPECRMALIKKAFQKMDKTGDNYITVADLKGVYNAKLHPNYENGKWDEDRVFEEFLSTFECQNSLDAKSNLGRISELLRRCQRVY